MDLSVIVGVVLGFAVAYWVVATACSFIVETIASFLNIRGKALTRFASQMVGALPELKLPTATAAASTLDRAVERILSWFRFGRREQTHDRLHRVTCGSLSTASQVALRLFTHPIIKALEKPTFNSAGNNVPASYIPAEQFARALLDVVAKMPSRQTLQGDIEASSLPRTLKDALIKQIPADKAALDATPASQLLDALKTAAQTWLSTTTSESPAAAMPAAASGSGAPSTSNLKLLAASGIPTAASTTQRGDVIAPSRLEALAAQVVASVINQAGNGGTLKNVEAALANDLIPHQLRAALKPMVEQAALDLEEARKSIERWYEGTMERASGWYKRYAMVWLGVTGFCIAGLFGLDSIRIGKDLATNSEHRAAAERLARRINESPDEVRAWVQRTVVTAGLSKDSILNSDKLLLPDVTRDKTSRSKLLWELQAMAASFGEAKYAAASVLAVLEDFPPEGDQARVDDKVELVATWSGISEQLDLARDCAPPAKPEGACARTSFQQAIEGARKIVTDDNKENDKDVPDLGLAYWTDVAIINPANIDTAKAMHAAFLQPEPGKFKDFQDKLKARALPFPWFVSTDFVWPLARVADADSFWAGLRAFLRDFFDGWPGKLITAFMVALGAPFWYELIGKVVNIRGTGSKPAT